MSDDADDNVEDYEKKIVPFRLVVSSDDDHVDPTYGDIDCDMILEAAKGKLEQVIVIGLTDQNSLYFAMSQGLISENLLLLEYARLSLNEHMIP